MAKKKVVTSNVQTNHTLGEYQRYFSHLLAKGKLHRYELDEKNKLNPERQYWKITDEKGKTYYYELPKYIKPGDTRSAYSLRRVTHRRPARIALAIFAGTALVSFTSSIVAKNVFKPHFPDVPPEPVDLEGLQKQLHEFQEWKNDNPTGDATEKFSISELANTAIANALYNPASYHPETGYARRSLLTVGHAHSNSAAPVIPVDVYISNAFIFQNGDALEESVPYSDNPLAPQSGRRDFYIASEDKVNSNSGNPSSSTQINWNDKWDEDKSGKNKETYTNEVGKYPDNPFLYSVNENTILESSTVSKTDTGYEIKMQLDPVKAVAGYVLRMKYLSGKQVTKFLTANLTFITDNNLQLIYSEVPEETYYVDSGIALIGSVFTSGGIKTYYYYDDAVPNIPSRKESFDYSKYPKE